MDYLKTCTQLIVRCSKYGGIHKHIQVLGSNRRKICDWSVGWFKLLRLSDNVKSDGSEL